MKTVSYMLAMILLLQFGLSHVIPDRWVFNYRVEYTTIKNNMGPGLDRAMDHVERQIQAHPEEEYVVLLGDSVMYSGPGRAEQSIGYYLEQWSQEAGRPVKVYNFAQPGMSLADIYTVLLMLQEHEIPLKRVVIDQVYSDYVARGPGEPGINWLQEELRTRDPVAWQKAGGQLLPQKQWTSRFRQTVLGEVSLWRYRDLLKAKLFAALPFAAGAGGEVADVRPWYEKAWLVPFMQQPAYQRFVDPRPLELTEANPHIWLWKRMFQRLQGADVTVFFAPVNQELMETDRPGYRENLKRIDDWFAAQPVRYVSWESAIPANLFVDHVHLLPEGYRQLAGMIGELLAQSR